MTTSLDAVPLRHDDPVARQPRQPRQAPATDPPPGRGPRPWRAVLAEPAFTILTILLDLAAVVAAVALALAVGGEAADKPGASQLWLFVPLALLCLGVRRMYRRHLRIKWLDEIEGLQIAVALAALGVLTLMLALGDHPRPGSLTIWVWLAASLLTPLGRGARASLQRHARRRCTVGTPALVIGAGPIAHQIVRRLQQLPEYGLRPLGLLARESTGAFAGDSDVPVLGRPEELVAVAARTGAQHVVVAFTEESDEELVAIARAGQGIGMDVSVVPRLFDAVGERVKMEHLGGLPLLFLHRVDPRSWQFALKHALDRSAAAVGVLVLSPVLLTLAALVRLSSPGPIFFRQRRIGRDGQPFDVLKFRSMRPPRADAAEFRLKQGAAPGGVEGEDRRTAIGKLMRKTSLDELPQLFNVLRGDMSLVGPRPERPEFVVLFEEQIRRYGERHRVKAGITGWAQVHGLRGQTSIADRAEWDNYYIENWSLRLDFKILALTFLTLFRPGED